MLDELEDPLIFIDTNILLDFYRSRGDKGLALLKKVDKLHNRIITSYQVEMEFKKNRQKVILEGIGLLKEPDDTKSVTGPAFLHDGKALEMINRRLSDARTRIKSLKERVRGILDDPYAKDPVFQITQRLFTNDSTLNLKRDDERRSDMKERAWNRFRLGYPPRKKEDTSAGDGFNWEWILEIAKTENRDILIVSRDSDFGITYSDKSYINDWLRHEFKDRVSKKRKIALVNRLTIALKGIAIEVTSEEEIEEDFQVRFSEEFAKSLDPVLRRSLLEQLNFEWECAMLDDATEGE